MKIAVLVSMQEQKSMEVVCINDDYNEDEGNIAGGPATQGGRAGGGSSLSSEVPPLRQIYYLVLYTMFNVV